MTNQAGHTQQAFPSFLQDYGRLYSHFQTEFEPLNSMQRGDVFAEFTAKLVPHTESGQRFERPQKRQTTHDGGVDLSATTEDESEVLHIQAKYTIRGVDELDLIISKFQAFETEGSSTVQLELKLPPHRDEVEPPRIHFMIVTASDLYSRIVPKYERSRRRTVEFYNELRSEERLHIIDGPQLLPLLKEAYRKSHLLPSNFELFAAKPFVRMGNVFIGIVAAAELSRLYKLFGDSLFLEDVREYLGPTSGVKPMPGRITVNQAIAQTLDNEPAHFLARNNGITFRAGSIEALGGKTLKLGDASIVNGCQTTMSIVRNPSDECYVLVKVVEAPDSWDIAEATNFQNEVDQIVLKLARYIRPQMIRAAANRFSVRFQSPETSSVFAVVDSIYQREISEQEFRALFIALFSSSPRNALSVNYAELKTDIIDRMFGEGNPDQEMALEVLFSLNQITREAAEAVEQRLKERSTELSDLFQRFWKDSKPNYRALLTVLAGCGCMGEDIYAETGRPSYEDLMHLLTTVQGVIENDPGAFIRYYEHAFVAVAIDMMGKEHDRDQLLQHMKSILQHTSFANLYLKLQALTLVTD